MVLWSHIQDASRQSQGAVSVATRQKATGQSWRAGHLLSAPTALLASSFLPQHLGPSLFAPCYLCSSTALATTKRAWGVIRPLASCTWSPAGLSLNETCNLFVRCKYWYYSPSYSSSKVGALGRRVSSRGQFWFPSRAIRTPCPRSTHDVPDTCRILR